MIDFPAGASREGNFHKHVYINDLIQSVVGDVHSIEKTLFLITSKFDRAITIISELQSAEAATTKGDLIIHSKDRLVLPQIFSKEQCGPQNTDPEYTLNVSLLSDIQKSLVLQSNPNTQAETHAACERQTNPHELFNENPIDLLRQEEDNILCEGLKSSRSDGHEPLGEDVAGVKKEPLQENDRDKKAEKIDIEVMEERMSWTHKCITVG